MLYVSTRNGIDSFTAYRALHEDRTPDGGLYVPQRLNALGADELAKLVKMSFGERIARILNIFFPVALTGFDVDFAIGRRPYKLVRMNSKLYTAEFWHNLLSDFTYVENALYTKLCEGGASGVPSCWARIAIRVAVLFGLYGEFSSLGIEALDFASFAGDYSFVTAALYAKRMGLPVGKIICASEEKGDAWNRFHKGEFSFVGDSTCHPALEVLIYEMFGLGVLQSFLTFSAKREIFRLDAGLLSEMNRALDGAVISAVRCGSLIKSIFRTHEYVCDPTLAVTYGALQDYRARTGENRTTLLISEISPKAYETIISKAIGITPAEMRKIISNS